MSVLSRAERQYARAVKNAMLGRNIRAGRQLRSTDALLNIANLKTGSQDEEDRDDLGAIDALDLRDEKTPNNMDLEDIDLPEEELDEEEEKRLDSDLMDQRLNSAIARLSRIDLPEEELEEDLEEEPARGSREELIRLLKKQGGKSALEEFADKLAGSKSNDRVVTREDIANALPPFIPRF